ncbi:J domain-containing protein-like [Watersipora subatra]|uniref:J domain-containing protein-like n=1 Tax=Watersipora subatra TaxID=2589382 RepID=UPI00355C0623
MVDAIFSFDSNKELCYYELLGCDETSSVEQINTEFKIRALKEHPDKNIGDESSSVETFQLLQEAKEVLTNPEKRMNYDKWRNSGIAMSYKQWCGLNESTRTTMHWASKPQTKPMIKAEETPRQALAPAISTVSAPDYIVGGAVWKRERGNDLLDKFRNYEI